MTISLQALGKSSYFIRSRTLSSAAKKPASVNEQVFESAATFVRLLIKNVSHKRNRNKKVVFPFYSITLQYAIYLFSILLLLFVVIPIYP